MLDLHFVPTEAIHNARSEDSDALDEEDRRGPTSPHGSRLVPEPLTECPWEERLRKNFWGPGVLDVFAKKPLLKKRSC